MSPPSFVFRAHLKRGNACFSERSLPVLSKCSIALDRVEPASVRSKRTHRDEPRAWFLGPTSRHFCRSRHSRDSTYTDAEERGSLKNWARAKTPERRTTSATSHLRDLSPACTHASFRKRRFETAKDKSMTKA